MLNLSPCSCGNDQHDRSVAKCSWYLLVHVPTCSNCPRDPYQLEARSADFLQVSPRLGAKCEADAMWEHVKKGDQPLWAFHSFPQRWSMSDKSRIIGFLDKVFRDSNPTLALLTSLACSARSDSCLMITLSSHCPPRSKTWSCFCLTIENLAIGHTLPVQYTALYKSTMIKKTRW